MNLEEISKTILELKKKDDKLRAELLQSGSLSNNYNQEMEALHNSNAKKLRQIMRKIGFPTSDKVGEEASNAAWLIIQHAIGQPDFMREAAGLLKKAVDKGKASPIKLAYLTDRIAVFEGGLQRFGTQFDWDENGEMNPSPFDDLTKVNQRRKALDLNTLEEQIKMMRDRIESENQQPPQDFQERKQAYDKWRKSVGWIFVWCFNILFIGSQQF